MFSLVFLPKRFLSLAPPPGGAWSCAGLRLSKNSLNLFHNLAFPSRLAGAKVQLFSLRATLFFDFLKLFYIILIIKLLKTIFFQKNNAMRTEKTLFRPKRSLFCQGSLENFHDFEIKTRHFSSPK
jgi:hypothetical protein